MRILKIDGLINVCRTMIRASDEISVEVEEMLVQALLINICAEFERTLKELVNERCSTMSDPAVYEYATSYSDTAFSSPSPKNIGDAVSKFGNASSRKFTILRSEGGEAWEAYRSVVSNRNNAAHGRQVQATMSDVERFYENGHVVLDWFKEALWAGEQSDGKKERPVLVD